MQAVFTWWQQDSPTPFYLGLYYSRASNFPSDLVKIEFMIINDFCQIWTSLGVVIQAVVKSPIILVLEGWGHLISIL